MPGQTAFWWQDSASYRQSDRTAILNGNVHMISMGYSLSLPSPSTGNDEPLDKKRQRTELWCQKFTVAFAKPREAPGPAGADFADLSGMDELQISGIEADGFASLLASDVNAEGQTISYDIDSRLLQIDGSKRAKASLIYLNTEKAQWFHWTGRKILYDTLKRQGSAEGGKLEILR